MFEQTAIIKQPVFTCSSKLMQTSVPEPWAGLSFASDKQGLEINVGNKSMQHFHIGMFTLHPCGNALNLVFSLSL